MYFCFFVQNDDVKLEENNIKSQDDQQKNGKQQNEKQKNRSPSIFVNLLIIIDILAVVAQISGALVWCLFQYLDFNQTGVTQHPYPWSVPVAVILTSCGWWENFTEKDSWTSLGKFLWRIRSEMYVKEVKKKIYPENYRPKQRARGILGWISSLFSKTPDEEKNFETKIEKKPGTRHRVYTMIIPVKLLTFYVSMVLITWWTVLIGVQIIYNFKAILYL